MSLTRRQFLTYATAALTALPNGAAAQPKSNPPFRRGGAIHTMMNWGAVREGEGRYQSRPFEAPRNVFPAALVRDFANHGFDFIRLTLDVGPFMQLQGPDKEALEQKLIDNIGLFHDLGLAVLVDCHPVEQIKTYSAPSILDDLEGTPFLGYTATISRLAALLATVRSGHVALELMNEPVINDMSHQAQVRVWGAAQLILHDAARKTAPDLQLLLTGADYGGISGLTHLDPSPFISSNTLFSYHYYMPLSFTHQGLDFGSQDAPAMPYVVDLPYPYDAVSPKDLKARIEARIAAANLDSKGKKQARDHASRILRGFLSDAWNSESIKADFARVTDWADRNHIAPQRIIMGECGVTRRDGEFTGADPVYRRRWLSDVTHMAQSSGFGWALWEINGKEFGIFRDDDNSRLDPQLIDALAMAS